MWRNFRLTQCRDEAIKLYRIIESERLPAIVGAQEFHYSRRFQMAALACPCGCGHRIMLNLLDQHSLKIEGGRPTVHPSILVADAPCLSHFWLRRGSVSYAQQWSQAEVDKVMAAQLRRHLQKAASQKVSWWRKLHVQITQWLSDK